jgi:hypothetical protein
VCVRVRVHACCCDASRLQVPHCVRCARGSSLLRSRRAALLVRRVSCQNGMSAELAAQVFGHHSLVSVLHGAAPRPPTARPPTAPRARPSSGVRLSELASASASSSRPTSPIPRDVLAMIPLCAADTLRALLALTIDLDARAWPLDAVRACVQRCKEPQVRQSRRLWLNCVLVHVRAGGVVVAGTCRGAAVLRGV